MQLNSRALLTTVSLGALLPAKGWALEWGGGNWSEEVWGFFEAVPALGEIGLGILTVILISFAWWLLSARAQGRHPPSMP